MGGKRDGPPLARRPEDRDPPALLKEQTAHRPWGSEPEGLYQAARRCLTSLPADLNDRLGEGCFSFDRLRVGLEVSLRRNQVHEFFRDVDV